jgi:uncharacterized protein DUF3572
MSREGDAMNAAQTKRLRGGGSKQPGVPTREAAAALAIEALSHIANDPEHIARFLALTGIDAGAIRVAAREPAFLAGVLEYVCADERLLIACAGHAGVLPAAIEKARLAFGRNWERDVP